ncbi:hypothetical protein BG011_002924 [Mortierella polycephala]|uniref:Uncharacterized protein n=1 Tax=Mortierella polycephala TaxID=41804 RepID=A0A9P6QDU3_9FUNG|nr:hypothetical protein BG011_002924 [Mortierella polycephala]
MFARKGITSASSQRTILTGFRSAHAATRIPNLTRTSPPTARPRFLSTSKPTFAQTPSEPARVPRPIPLDIGNSPSSAFFQSSSASASLGTVAAGAEGAAARKYRSARGGSVFGRFGEPIIKVIIYSTAATLALHLLYHQLALEEYKIASNRQVAELETEIEELKAKRVSNTVQHTLGGRGEFI